MPKSSRDRKGAITSSNAGYGNPISKILGQAEINDPSQAESPEQVPYQYKGDPSSLVGVKGFVTRDGQFSDVPAQDTRNWLQRLTTPNEAGEINKQYKLGQIQREQGFQDQERSLRLSEKVKQENAEINARDAAASAALMTMASKYGLPPSEDESIKKIYAATVEQELMLAAQKAQEAKTGTLKSKIDEEALAATRIPNINRLVSQANEGATRANIGEQFAQNNPKAIEAGLLGHELLPALSVARGNTMSVASGEYMRRFTSGSPIIDSYFPQMEGQGMTQDERTVMQTIGGMQFPTQQKMTTPGSIKPIFSGKIPTGAAPQQQAAPSTMPSLQEQQQQVVPPRRMPGRSSGGQPMDQGLPPEMLNALPTEEQKREEWLKQIMRRMYTEPKF